MAGRVPLHTPVDGFYWDAGWISNCWDRPEPFPPNKSRECWERDTGGHSLQMEKTERDDRVTSEEGPLGGVGGAGHMLPADVTRLASMIKKQRKKKCAFS